MEKKSNKVINISAAKDLIDWVSKLQLIMQPLSKSILDIIQKECTIKPNQLICIDDLPKNIQQKIQESALNTNEQKSNLFLIKVPSNSNENVLKIYLNYNAINNDLEKQRLRVKLLQNERDRLNEMNKKTNNNLKKDKKMIDILHKYNEIKDVAQKLMGTLNQMKGTT
eukprot:441716_1